MTITVRWWHLVGAGGFAGGFVVPVLGLVVDAMLTLQSITATASGSASAGGPRAGFLAVGIALAVAVVVAVPALSLGLYRDARSAESTAWTPNARRYAVLGLAYPVSVVVAGYYLSRRYRHVGVGGLPVDGSPSRGRLGASQWWYAVAVGSVLVVAGVGVLLAPGRIAPTFAGDLYVRVAGLAALSGTGTVLFHVGLVADITQIREGDVDWTPGVRRYALPSTLVPVVTPLVAAVYLSNRRRYVGAP